MKEHEMQHSLQLEEKVAKLIPNAEQYPVIKALDQPIVVSFALPNGETPKVVVFCRSVKDFHKAGKKVEDTPEEFILRVVNDQARSIKALNPSINVIAVFSDYDEERLNTAAVEHIAKSLDFALINKEIKDLPELTSALLRRS